MSVWKYSETLTRRPDGSRLIRLTDCHFAAMCQRPVNLITVAVLHYRPPRIRCQNWQWLEWFHIGTLAKSNRRFLNYMRLFHHEGRQIHENKKREKNIENYNYQTTEAEWQAQLLSNQVGLVQQLLYAPSINKSPCLRVNGSIIFWNNDPQRCIKWY